MSGKRLVLLLIGLIIIITGVWGWQSLPHKRRYYLRLYRFYLSVRNLMLRETHRADITWVKRSKRFIPAKIVISDFEQVPGRKPEWRGKNVILVPDLNHRYIPVSGRTYLSVRVKGGATGSIEKIFDEPQNFSHHHFQWWIRGELLDRDDLKRPAYHSEIESYGDGLLNQYYETYIYFYSDPKNYSRYRFIFLPQYNDWYPVTLHRGDTSKVDFGKGVDWKNVRGIRFEIKAKSIPFTKEDVDPVADTILLRPKRWGRRIPPLHTGAKVQFKACKRLPQGLIPSKFYWVYDAGLTEKGHLFKFSTNKENLKNQVYVDLNCPESNCSGEVVTLPLIMFDNFEAVETLPVPLITFRFDDNYRNTFLYAKPILDEFGWKGVFAVVAQKETTEGYGFCLDCRKEEFVSYEEVRKMQADGWDVVVHGFHHKAMGDGDCSGVPDGTVEDIPCYNQECTEEEFSMGRRILESIGINKGSRFWVWPFGTINSISDIALKLIPDYYEMGSGCWPKSPAGIPLTHRYLLPIAELDNNLSEEEQLAFLKRQIDDTCKFGGWLTILFHRIYVPDGVSHKDEHSTRFLREVCNYLRLKQKTLSSPPAVVTFSEIYDNLIKEKVTSQIKAKKVLSPPVTHHYHSFQLLPAEDGLVKIFAHQRSITVSLPYTVEAQGRTYNLMVAEMVEPNTITLKPRQGETIVGRPECYKGLDKKGKLVRLKADSSKKDWSIFEGKVYHE